MNVRDRAKLAPAEAFKDPAAMRKYLKDSGQMAYAPDWFIKMIFDLAESRKKAYSQINFGKNARGYSLVKKW